MTIGF